MSTESNAKARGGRLVLIAYLVALAVAVATGVAVASAGESRPLWIAFWADIAGTLAIFAFSWRYDNSSFYDAYWSVAPPVIALYFVAVASPGASAIRQLLVVLLVFAWGIRLTWNWWRGWTGLDHEDWRYVDMRETAGSLYWVVSLLALHAMPTVLVYLGCFALLPALATGSAPLGWLDAVAVLVAGGAILIEARADEELRAYRASKPPAGSFLRSGLWSRSRHPNYLGEIGFWWGLSLFALAADQGALWVLVGPLSINLLFVFASLRLIDRRMVERRPDYAAHMERVPAILPRPWRAAADSNTPAE